MKENELAFSMVLIGGFLNVAKDIVGFMCVVNSGFVN